MQTANLNYNFVPSGGVREVGDKLVISGTASNWDVDRVGDAVVRAAMERALAQYMANPILLFNHSYSLPAGRVTRAFIDDDGLHIEAELPRPKEPGTARHWWDLVKAGVVRALSIGGKWTRQRIGGVNYLTEIDLREISVAAQGINATTTFTAQAAKAFGDPLPPDMTATVDDLRLLALKAALYRAEYDVAAIVRAGHLSQPRRTPGRDGDIGVCGSGQLEALNRFAEPECDAKSVDLSAAGRHGPEPCRNPPNHPNTSLLAEPFGRRGRHGDSARRDLPSKRGWTVRTSAAWNAVSGTSATRTCSRSQGRWG